MILEPFLFESKNARSAEALCSSYARLLESLGYDQIAHNTLSTDLETDSVKKPRIFFNKNLEQWEEHYFENRYLESDLVHKQCLLTPGIFVWSDLVVQQVLSTSQRRVFQEAEAAGLYNGLTVAIHGPNQTKASTIVSTSDKTRSLPPFAKELINVATYHFHLCKTSLSQEHEGNTPRERNRNALTAKEQETLQWFAKGLSRSEIAEKMHLSTHTVDYYFRKIVKKMKARNITSALVTAINRNVLTLW